MEELEMKSSAVYEERVVAFIDILGFRDIIKRSEKDQELAISIRRILNYIKYLRDENRAGKYPECNVVGRQITIFSDSIIISYPTSCISCLFDIIFDIVHIQQTMFNNRFPIRGGISLGCMHHQRDIAFGPAFIEAYDLETKCAFYPRIVITEDVIETGLTKNPHNHPAAEKEYVYSFLRKDSDGLYYVDFLNQRQETNDDGEYSQMLMSVRRMVTIGLSAHDKAIRQKYEWLKNKYNASIKQQHCEALSPLID
jgi:hypothetical protein